MKWLQSIPRTGQFILYYETYENAEPHLGSSVYPEKAYQVSWNLVEDVGGCFFLFDWTNDMRLDTNGFTD